MAGVSYASPVSAASTGPTSMVSPAGFKADIQAMRADIRATHPQLSYTANVGALDRVIARLVAGVHKPITREEAWRRLATLNPVFSDGHLAIIVHDWRKHAAEYLAKGGAFFPFEVWVNPQGRVLILSALGGGTTPLKGERITSINGVPIHRIAKQLLARAHGDTPTFRAALLSKRWWWYFWKMYGAKPEFTIGVAGKARPVEVPASTASPIELQDQAFKEEFQFALKPPDAAALTIRSFYWKDKNRYFAFMKDAFAKIKRAHVSRLVIDIRDNGGGDDDMWMHGILDYIADKPYRWGSTYKKKIIAKYRDKGEVVGDVKVGKIQSVIQPKLDNPLFFHGKTYVLIGPYTYSSAILFANVVRDYGFATVAGSGDSAKVGQTGGLQAFILPNTGLEFDCPRFYLLPPSGEAGRGLLQPEIALPYDPLQPQRAIQALLNR